MKFLIEKKYIPLLVLLSAIFLLLSSYYSINISLFNHYRNSRLRNPAKTRMRETTNVNCKKLQSEINSLILYDSDKWSMTILNKDLEILMQINGDKARIPASNQKLFTTAYALDRLGPDKRFTTRIFQRKDKTIEIIGQGDPDLNRNNIEELINNLFAHKLFRPIVNDRIKVVVYDISKKHWWPSDWHLTDRSFDYGAPITTIALESNSSYNSLTDPNSQLLKILDDRFRSLNLNVDLAIRDRNEFIENVRGRTLISESQSASLKSLLSLANSESHNFTAEILLRNTANDWQPASAIGFMQNWITSKGITAYRFNLNDGSGLSRNNRLTTNGITKLLWTMSNHKHSADYKSSLAVLGIRGTLRDLGIGSNIEGRFYGKTGTLEGVRSMSGILDRYNDSLFISIISNGALDPQETMIKSLSAINKSIHCH